MTDITPSLMAPEPSLMASDPSVVPATDIPTILARVRAEKKTVMQRRRDKARTDDGTYVDLVYVRVDDRAALLAHIAALEGDVEKQRTLRANATDLLEKRSDRIFELDRALRNIGVISHDELIDDARARIDIGTIVAALLTPEKTDVMA